VKEKITMQNSLNMDNKQDKTQTIYLQAELVIFLMGAKLGSKDYVIFIEHLFMQTTVNNDPYNFSILHINKGKNIIQ
jgi:hypothetical protein